jgi:hypothetical protein
LILNTDYPPFLEQFYAESPDLARAPFERQMRARMETMFGVADFYSHALRELGHEAIDVHANNGRAQQAWGREHDVVFGSSEESRRELFPWACRTERGHWLYEVLLAQVRHYRPDVLLNQAMDLIEPAALRAIKPLVGLLVGQHASPPLKEEADWGAYDLAVSSFLPRVEWLRAKGLRAELNRLGFDPRVAARVGAPPRDIPLSFVGSFFEMHTSRTALLERLAAEAPLKVWGMTPKNGLGDSPLARCHQGPAWGLQMYGILARSQIVINHHGNVPAYANNLRLFESTGCGAMLLTDHKPNLGDLFALDREVVAYRNDDECVGHVRQYLADDAGRERVAAAGRARTLADHTFRQRMGEFVRIVTR